MTRGQAGVAVVVLVLISLTATGAAMAQQVYRFVDESGRVVFSDQPPPSGVDAEEVAVPETETAASGAEAGERMERMLSVTDKLQQDRIARETERQAAQAAAVQAREPPPVEPAEDDDDGGGWYPVYGPGYGWGPGWPGYGPPHHRPPRPPWHRPPEWSPEMPPPPRMRFNPPAGIQR